MKSNEIRDLTIPEIERKIKENREMLFNLNLKLSTRQIENTSQIRLIKRDIARLLTILKEKKIKEAVKG
ncbi:MAG: 50S ribosomal protein L29 [Candidatus Goldbacteria bacterium]|nr:50S ribosomal protein L29 [Candidatus Goldiibacteriota bacterium]HPD18728.1 50S ribosomal protein L29 [Candidatus Goldiibacteriota bacterium]